MKYCNNCKQWVKPTKKFHGCLFVFLLFTCFGWIIYLIWYGIQKRKCPMCKSTNWGLPHEEIPKIYYVQSEKPPQPKIYCEYCGFQNEKSSMYCVNCGNIIKK